MGLHLAEEASETGVQDEVDRRVRRSVGFKVMRDLHQEASAMEAERRGRPRLVSWLLVLVALVAAGGLAVVWLWYRG